MTFNRGLFLSKTGEHETPQDLFDELNEEFGGIPLDVCAWDWNAKCPAWFTPFDDALSLDWHWVLTDVLHERPLCWMNPPYGRVIENWIAKAFYEMWHGVTTIALLPARTDTRWFHDWIWNRFVGKPMPMIEVRFLKGRLKFSNESNSAPFPSMVVVFGKDYTTSR